MPDFFGNVKCAVCARQGRTLGFRSMGYCQIHRAYFCNSCQKGLNGCPLGDHGTDAISHKPIGFGLVIVIVMVFISLIIVPTILSVTEHNNMQVTAISNLQDGNHVKIEGRISSNSSIPIIGHLEDDGGRLSEWKYQTLPIMNISDSTGIIEVDLGNYSRIYKGPSESVDAQNRTISEYRDGDPVSVIGTVETMSNGRLRLRAELIAKDSTSFGYSMPEVIWFLGGAIIFGIILIIIGLWLNYKRVQQYHMSGQEQKAVESWPVVTDNVSIQKSSVGEIDWLNNDLRAQFIKLQKKILVVGIIVIIPLITLLSISILNGQICFCQILLFLTLIPTAFILMFYYSESWVPTRVGFSNQGLHVDYPKAPTSSSQFNFIRWSDISDISYGLTFFMKEKEEFLTRGYKLIINVRPVGRLFLTDINEGLANEVIRRFHINRPDIKMDEKLERIKEIVK
jgi:hypothetical protein